MSTNHAKRPCSLTVLISGLANTWSATHAWTPDRLMVDYGDKVFRISQRSSKKASIKFRDYISYSQIQHDEDPLYIFDDKFGEVAPGLLKDYSVPHLFQEDWFDVLERDKRPPFRWLIIGPERSGASWHVDPALTSAWNTLLYGRKRWALYPPGRVPLGVTVHVNEDDGDVSIDTPTSLQWWLDFYPLLADEEKPIECTQLPGETIYVPSGWWHCVLNLETTVAVTQNFVNSKNFEFVCLDMAPGYRHKGLCRAGLLALEENALEVVKENALHVEESILRDVRQTSNGKRAKVSESGKEPNSEIARRGAINVHDVCNLEFSYDINFLAMFLDKERDHYNALWSSGNSIGQRELREWLWTLWVGKPGHRDLIWKGACLALNAGKWSACMGAICSFHELQFPSDDEKLPVGTGSNPVYLVADNVIKIYVEDGLEASLHSIGTELEFYSLLCEYGSSLKNHIPDVLASGIVIFERGSYKVKPWNGKGLPDIMDECDLNLDNISRDVDFPFGIWSKKQFEYRNAGTSEPSHFRGHPSVWPYIVTKRCKGKLLSELADRILWEDTVNLASFLGEQLRNLHLMPFPPLCDLFIRENNEYKKDAHYNSIFKSETDGGSIPAEWKVFLGTLNKKRKDVVSRLFNWGDPIPKLLIERVQEYIPEDFENILNIFQCGKGVPEVCRTCTWIHADIMDDNIIMEPSSVGSGSGDTTSGGLGTTYSKGELNLWRPSHILDFGNMSVGDPICDLIPLYLDVFKGDSRLLKKFLESYQLPLMSDAGQKELLNQDSKFYRTSYLAMCYCILHDDNILGAIFSIWKELRMSQSWEDVEEAVWGELNNYTGLT
ncbi:lysine-specific demethylase JMJ21 isoform X2 [Daucus carota subsp. sativus]|uniref:lysine-specific demethylase JMJ21 isoform X2 n=1 Tax=Daucus carota subsp. sativus TaxID=79200 RepID=UPI0030833E26